MATPKGAVVIPNMKSLSQNNRVTTIKDGSIIMEDGTTKLVEDLSIAETTINKPGEIVKIKTNQDMSVTETITDENGNLISQKILDKQDQNNIVSNPIDTPIVNSPVVK